MWERWVGGWVGGVRAPMMCRTSRHRLHLGCLAPDHQFTWVDQGLPSRTFILAAAGPPPRPPTRPPTHPPTWFFTTGGSWWWSPMRTTRFRRLWPSSGRCRAGQGGWTPQGGAEACRTAKQQRCGKGATAAAEAATRTSHPPRPPSCTAPPTCSSMGMKVSISRICALSSISRLSYLNPRSRNSLQDKGAGGGQEGGARAGVSVVGAARLGGHQGGGSAPAPPQPPRSPAAAAPLPCGAATPLTCA